MARRHALNLALLASSTAPMAQTLPGPDLLSFAHGVVPMRVEADAAAKVRPDLALRLIDGDRRGFVVTAPVPPGTRVAFVYELPAPTVFERFAVPDVLETPSPGQTFFRDVRVLGSATGADEGFVELASATLATHRARGQETELAIQRRTPVRWLRLELSGAVDAPRPKVALEFSELIGQGRQEAAPTAHGFGGVWKGRGVKLALRQQGPAVDGCYDREGQLAGTVRGNVLHATGATRQGIPSTFVAVLGGDGQLHALRSSNGGPFYASVGTLDKKAAPPAACFETAAPTLGCGSVIHAIGFDFDAATLRPDAAPALDALHAGLAADAAARVTIEGHTSSEGAEAYNLELSQARAQSVVDALVQRGIARDRLAASGAGEARPIASNDDESGRSLNRRVEVRCTS